MRHVVAVGELRPVEPSKPAAPRGPMKSTQKKSALDVVVRLGVVQAFAHLHKISVEQARQAIANEYPRYGDEVTKVFCEYTARAATAPALRLAPAPRLAG